VTHHYGRGDLVVIVVGVHPNMAGATNLIYVHRIGTDDCTSY